MFSHMAGGGKTGFKSGNGVWATNFTYGRNEFIDEESLNSH